MDLNLNQSIMINTSLVVMKSFLLNQTMSLSASILNMVCCSFTLTIMLKCKLMNGRGFQLLKFFLSNDLLASFMMFVYNVFHLSHNILDVPELMSRRRCFALFGLQYLFVFNDTLITFLISVDRTISVFFPHFYMHSMPAGLNIHFFVASTVTSCLVYVGGLFDRFPTEFVFYCTARGSAGVYLSIYYWIISTALSFCTCTVYAILLLFLRFRITQSSSNNDQQQSAESAPENTITKKKRALAQKVTKVVAFTTLCYVAVGPFQNFVTVLLLAYLPDLVLVMGTYVGILSFLEGSMYTMCLMIFVEDFRLQFKLMIGLKK